MPNINNRMTLSLYSIIRLAGIAGLVAAIILSPELAAKFLSSDGILESHTITEINVWRLLAAITGMTFLVGTVAWRSQQVSKFRSMIELDYANWKDPFEHLTAADRQWMRWATASLWLCVAVALLTLFVSFSHAESRWFQLLAWENGLIESIQALCLLAAGIILPPLAWRDWSQQHNILSGIGLLFGFLLVVAAGEEISWGQHWLGFETPEQLMKTNVQGEFNLHNIGSYWVNNLLTLFFLTYFGFRPIFEYFYPHLRYVLDRMSMPAAPLLLAPVALISVCLDDNDVVTRLWGNPPFRLSEGRELLFGASILIVTLLMRRYRRNTN